MGNWNVEKPWKPWIYVSNDGVLRPRRMFRFASWEDNSCADVEEWSGEGGVVEDSTDLRKADSLIVLTKVKPSQNSEDDCH